MEKATRAGANVRAPRKAHMARDRKLEKIPKKKLATCGKKDSKVSTWQRVEETKGEHPMVDGKLYCDAYKEKKMPRIKKRALLKRMLLFARKMHF